MRRLMYWIAGLMLFYVLIVIVAYLAQDFLIFPGAAMSDHDIERNAPRTVRVFRLQRPGGERFRVAESAPAEPRGVLVFFVGNGENLVSAVARAERMTRYGVAAVVPEYPGYGKSDGSPSEKSLMEAADAAAAYAERKAKELGVPLLVGGSSLGTFCAVHAAAGGRGQRLLLKAPPTRLADAAQASYWFLPVKLLIKHRFDNLAKASKVRCPVMIVHGTADSIVPVTMGQELAAAFGERAELVEVPGQGHNDPLLGPDGPVADRIRAFLRVE